MGSERDNVERITFKAPRLDPDCHDGQSPRLATGSSKAQGGPPWPRVERFYLPTSFPPNLKQLTLRYTYLPWTEIHIVGKLPNLETLKLKDFAFCGSKWEQTEMGFKKLKVLLISRLDFTSWNASANHFPILEKLVLKYCWGLKQVPNDFANIETLKSIVLESCYSYLVNFANDILRRKLTTDLAFFVNDLGTKVELPNNDSLEEDSVGFPNN
nr:putative late blight resistance protein homolog R1A-10 isoform X2 [Ipomoea batatas]